MKKDVAIIGGGPAGLMAAELLSKAGCAVTVYERKPSVGRKLLMAGRGGLNITHSEPLKDFLARYGSAEKNLSAAIHDFSPADLRGWTDGLGQKTFIGSSGRVFPESLKASPLLRAWLLRLENGGVVIKRQHEWTGWDDRGSLLIRTTTGKTESINPDATLLALGGASWPSLGSDGGWIEYFANKKIPVSPLRPANCGFEVSWTPYFREKFSGQPLKSIAITFDDHTINGEIMITANGIEGGGVYALSSGLRDKIERVAKALITVDLRPTMTIDTLIEKLNTPRGKQSFSTYLKKSLNLSPVMISLLHEVKKDCQTLDAISLAKLIKNTPLTLNTPFPLERAISTAGGVEFGALDETFMLKSIPGVFVAGEMMDWEAPTGGYLLQATLATAHTAASGMLRWLERPAV